MNHDIVFLVVLALIVYLYWKERKGRIWAETQVLSLSGQVARVASEAANANAEMVAAQAPLVRHHELLLDYLRKNDGKSIDDAKEALKILQDGVEVMGARVADIAVRRVLDAPCAPTRIEGPGHHRDLLDHIRRNPGMSVDQAKRELSNKAAVDGD